MFAFYHFHAKHESGRKQFTTTIVFLFSGTSYTDVCRHPFYRCWNVIEIQVSYLSEEKNRNQDRPSKRNLLQ